MPLIAKREAKLLRARLQALLEGPVRIDLFVRRERELFRVADRCSFCPQTRLLFEELAALCARLELRVRTLPDDEALAREFEVVLVPAAVLSGAARGRVRYLGIPLGNELTTLLEDLVDVSRGFTDLPESVRESVKALRAPVHIELFVTPDCPYCPAVARLVHKLAVESACVTADVIEAGEFPELAARYGVEAVPSLVVNGRLALAGARPDRQLVEKVLRASGAAGG